jgi:hypothetical protein
MSALTYQPLKEAMQSGWSEVEFVVTIDVFNEKRTA